MCQSSLWLIYEINHWLIKFIGLPPRTYLIWRDLPRGSSYFTKSCQYFLLMTSITPSPFQEFCFCTCSTTVSQRHPSHQISSCSPVCTLTGTCCLTVHKHENSVMSDELDVLSVNSLNTLLQNFTNTVTVNRTTKQLAEVCPGLKYRLQTGSQ